MKTTCQQREWVDAMLCEKDEMRRLQVELRALEGAATSRLGALPGDGDRVRRMIEYTTARMIQHEVSIALLSARLAGALKV
jgi:hypothetical protein